MLNNKAGMKVLRFVAATVLISVALCSCVFVPTLAAGGAEKETRVVRVGWYESPFNITDNLGRRSGYAYEYQQKIAAFTGWKYEYVTGSWSDLMQMLIAGKIDLMSDVSYTEDRSELMQFSNLSMGSEDYFIFVSPDNEEITPENLSALNGKKVGINAGSVQIDLFRQWEEEHNINAEIVELSLTEIESLQKLQRGKIDAHVSLDGYFNPNEATPIARIGSSDFYFAVNNSCPEITEELNDAMKRIYNEDPYYNQKLNTKYIKVSGSSYFLDSEEKNWISEHKTIKVGYQDNYLAFCATDPETGKLTGALKDYFKAAEDGFTNADIKFEAIPFPTASAAMEAVKNGEVDCMFPANLTDYDGETQGFLMTNTLMKTDIIAIVLETVKDSFAKKEHITVAVNQGNPNYNLFLVDNFPQWRPIIFKDTPEGLKAIRDGKVDCLLMSNYRYNNVSKLCEKYNLSYVSTGVEIDYSFAVRRDNTIAYSILNKVIAAVPTSTVESALSYYFTEDAKLTFGDMLLQNISAILIVVGVVILALLILLLHNVRTRKLADTNQKLITATETDLLTGLYSKNFFYEYATQMYREESTGPMDVIVLNIEEFHSVNAIHGWDFGDGLIRIIGEAIIDFIDEHGGIGCRSEADRFAMYCPHLDSYDILYHKLQDRINGFSSGSSILLRMGVMPWEEGLPPRQQVEQALIACNMARGNYNEHIVVFDGKARERENFERRLKNDLTPAISRGDFKVYYQPKFDIDSDIPVLAGAEALVRWQHPELGLIPPDDFISLFEHSGQITLLDQHIWKEAATQLAGWKEKYGKAIPISINLSRIDVYDSQLEDRLDMLFREHKLDYSDISLEVTESAYTEKPEEMIEVIERLHRKGYSIEMDDFGAGYSSLSLLSSMPINVLKIDRGFIKNIEREKKNAQMVKIILDMAKELGISVVAEGVENETQQKLLKELGCKTVQGFYFSRPLPASEFENKYIRSL